MAVQSRSGESVSPTGVERTDGIAPLSRRDQLVAGRWQILLPLAFLLAAAPFYWLLTCGTGRIFDQEPLGFYYDSLADSLIHGKLDVSRGAIGSEAFVRAGKYYGYFGPTPALPRIVLNALFPTLWGDWSRLSLLTAYLFSLWFVCRLLKTLIEARSTASSSIWRELIVPIFIIAAGCGSPMIFLASRSFVFHEAILWASALSIASGYYLFIYLRTGKRTLLVKTGVMAILAFFARPTTGAGALLGVLFVAMLLSTECLFRRQSQTIHPLLRRLRHWFGAVATDHPGRDSLLAIGFCIAASGGYLGMNREKFGTWTGLPLQRYVQYQRDPARLQITGGKQIHLSNLRTGLAAYFGRIGVDVRCEFPWFTMRPRARVFPEARIDVNDWCSSVPGSMPALFLLACYGAGMICLGRSESARQLRVPVAALAVGGGIVFLTVGICQRYVQDFYPAIIFAAALGAARPTEPRLRRATRMGLLTFLLLTVGLSFLIEMAFGLRYQRELVWGVPEEKRAEFREWQKRVDRTLRIDGPPNQSAWDLGSGTNG